MLLAIDTATRLLSLAVHDGTTLLAEQTWQAPKAHTEFLAPAVRDILTHAETTMDDLTALAAVTGPGSYTGVRIGVSIIKGLAAAKNLPVIGVSTLDTLAAGQPKYDSTLITVVEAGRSRVIAGSYRWNYAQWVPRGEPRLLKWSELFDSIDGRVTIAGEVSVQARQLYEEKFQTQAEPTVQFATAAHSLRRAGFAAEVAWQRLRAGKPEDFAAAVLVPVYMNKL